ncbi:MAG: ferredoxin [Deltaproteobacteria bacterium]|jgi:ferredoxin|nr:ferredoxin [Deltaproteobacteria bacterium]MBW2483491.1 ferredoxin [Deltaproteobacteria bacterium]
MKKPLVELSDCIACGVCAEVSPDVFRLGDAGYIEIAELERYPEDEVNEAIKYCPTDCISWTVE